MDYGVIQIFNAILAAAGWKMALVIVVGVIVLVRLAPPWLADRRQRDTEDARARIEAQRALQQRIDGKDAMMEKILTNHIAHLELQLEASRAFYTIASERLSSISNEMKEARHQLDGLRVLAEENSDDLNFLKGRAS